MRALGRLGLALAGLVGGLLGLEGTIRLINPAPSEGTALLRGELTTPGEHRVRTAEYDVVVPVNAEGFVDRPWGEPRRPLVVVIGDSFVQAAQVGLEEGYGRQLERALGEGEVRSLGVPGAGTATALGLLDRHALPWKPDLVVLGFLVANDVLNNHPLLEGKDDKPFYRVGPGGLEPVDAAGWDPPGGPLWRWSAGWRWLAGEWATRKAAARKLELGRGLPVDLRVHDPVPDPVWEEAWGVTGALLAEMAARCREAGTGLGVVLFPDGVQATEAGRARATARWPASAGWDFSRAQARAYQIAAAVAPTLDLLPALRAADGPEPLYFAEDGHWTARGHRVAAEATAGFVKERLAERRAGGR